MKKKILLLFLGFCLISTLQAQNKITGIVVDHDSEKNLKGVRVRLKNTSLTTSTNAAGVFELQDVLNGQYILEISLQGYETQNFPIELTGKIIDLGTLFFYVDLSEEIDLSTISISDDELTNDASTADNIVGLLQSSRDVFLRTAAFEFSASFFKLRG